MVITVSDYGDIRRLYLVERMSQRQIAQMMGISLNTVKKYCEGNAVPRERKAHTRAPVVVTEEVTQFTGRCFDEDKREGTSKQRHTAKRIYDRLVSEMGFRGGESTIRDVVRTMKEQHKEAFVPLEFYPGEALQVDWGEALVYLGGQKRKVNLFCARLCASCAPIVFAYERQNEESFLEAFVKTFQYFGGVARKVFFDNARVAVKEGFGAHAKKQAGYTALSAHYGFEAVFCNPASGNEKGLVEGLVGWSRRNILVPLPRVADISELNSLLEARCRDYGTHTIRGKVASVGTMFAMEQNALLLLPGYVYDTSKSRNTRVDTYSTVRFDTNNYSVPVLYCGMEVSVKGYAQKVIVYHKSKQIAEHSRCFQKKQSVFHLAHYLPLLEKKGRAVFNAAPVRRNLPESFLDWISRQNFTHQKLMELLRHCAEHGWESVWLQKELWNATAETVATQDVVVVRSVDLHAYDLLCGRKVGEV